MKQESKDWLRVFFIYTVILTGLFYVGNRAQKYLKEHVIVITIKP